MAGYFMELEVIDNTRIFILPMHIDIPITERARSAKNKKRFEAGKPWNRYYLNLNAYRNWHHTIESKLKKLFQPLELPEYFKAEKIRVTYIIEKKSLQKIDTMNILSIVDKYFLDWLVTCNYIPDDNCTIVSHGAPECRIGCIESKCTAIVEILEEDCTQGILF